MSWVEKNRKIDNRVAGEGRQDYSRLESRYQKTNRANNSNPYPLPTSSAMNVTETFSKKFSKHILRATTKRIRK